MSNRQLYVGRQGAGPWGGSTCSGDWRWRAVLFLGLLLGAGNVAATPAPAPASGAVVEAVQWPAWLERAGARMPLPAGAELRGDDVLVTGAEARLLLRLADGSAVKVGESARIGVAALGRKEGGVLTAALDVARGAFRYTTGLFRKTLGRREVDVRVGTITIGIRGTDVWGKATAGEDWVLLLEGEISVTHAALGSPRDAGADSTHRSLRTPMTYLSAPRHGGAEILPADPEKVGRWARETELDAARPIARREGRHTAEVITLGEAAALTAWDQLRAAGYPARLRPRDDGRHAVVLSGLASRAAAVDMARRARAIIGAGASAGE